MPLWPVDSIPTGHTMYATVPLSQEGWSLFFQVFRLVCGLQLSRTLIYYFCLDSDRSARALQQSDAYRVCQACLGSVQPPYAGKLGCLVRHLADS